MAALFLHTWALSSKEGGGVNLRAEIIKIIREGGLTYVGTCPEDNLCLPSGPTLTTAQINEAFETMLATIADLEARVLELENP